MSRVVIIGNAEGGKSALTKKLAQAKGLPAYDVDKYQWDPGWHACSRNSCA